MMKILLCFAAAVALAYADCDVKRATVRLEASGVSGNITFTPLPNGNVRISGRIVGMPAGKYGFHVHEKGDITGGCASTLGHFNPHDKDHGHPQDENRHVGDLGNVEFDKNGVAEIDFEDHQIKLCGIEGIIGRGLVIHSGEDDYGRTDHHLSKQTGNAGDRVACGVIGIA